MLTALQEERQGAAGGNEGVELWLKWRECKGQGREAYRCITKTEI